MVFEGTDSWPSHEGQQLECAPPRSSYGFQKLAVEYFARAAWDQYQLPYTILRPFNCVGIGEVRALGELEVLSGNVRLAMSHVVPDLVQKIVRGQDPLHILGDGTQVRHYTYRATWQGIVAAIEHPDARRRNLSRPSRPRCSNWRKDLGAAAPGERSHRVGSSFRATCSGASRPPRGEARARFQASDARPGLDVVVPWIANSGRG
jgi:nucleoside-diphosphate-sugar epimerase